MQYRGPDGPGLRPHLGPSHGAPYWVRIVRQGNTFTGYASADGSSWTSIGSQTIAMAATAYIGLCVTAHNNAMVAAATFDSVWWTGALGGGGFDLGKLGPDVYLMMVSIYEGQQGTFAGVYVQVVDPAAVPAGNHAPSVANVTANPSTSRRSGAYVVRVGQRC